jgi:hypothetical protein
VIAHIHKMLQCRVCVYVSVCVCARAHARVQIYLHDTVLSHIGNTTFLLLLSCPLLFHPQEEASMNHTSVCIHELGISARNNISSCCDGEVMQSIHTELPG